MDLDRVFVLRCVSELAGNYTQVNKDASLKRLV